MKAIELINRAWVLAGIVGRDLDQVSGSQGEDGLSWLNQLISQKTATGDYIPYYVHVELDSVQGQEAYEVPNLVSIEAITFNNGPVRYSMTEMMRNPYWGNARIDNVDALPVTYYQERIDGGVKFWVYFKPNQVYRFNITGRQALSNVTFDTDLDESLDKFYQTYLMFELAEYLCLWYKITLPPQIQMKLAELRKNMLDINAKDLSIKKISTLGQGGVVSYAQINIGKGWTP